MTRPRNSRNAVTSSAVLCQAAVFTPLGQVPDVSPIEQSFLNRMIGSFFSAITTAFQGVPQAQDSSPDISNIVVSEQQPQNLQNNLDFAEEEEISRDNIVTVADNTPVAPALQIDGLAVNTNLVTADNTARTPDNTLVATTDQSAGSDDMMTMMMMQSEQGIAGSSNETTPSTTSTNPGDPNAPANPSSPGNPTGSNNPSNPSNPSNPIGPTNPGNPTGPANPTGPTGPVNPGPSSPVIIISAGIAIENQPIAINVSLTSDSAATTVVIIGNLPVGATLSAGIDNGNGTYTLTPAQLAGLTLSAPLYFSGDISLNVTATSSLNGQTQSGSATLDFDVSGVATVPNLSIANATGSEDSAIALTINASVVDADGSETLSVVVGNVPAGATLSAGVNNGDGTWTLTPAQLAGLQFIPALHFSGDVQLSITAISAENGTTAAVNATLDITVSGVATAPNLSLTGAAGSENSPITIVINAALVDADSETLSITISNVPNGAVLSAGINNGDGTWTLTPAQLTGLTLTPPLYFSGEINLGVAATASENGTTATTTGALVVDVSGVASTPILSVAGATGVENTAIALTVNAALVDTDGSENLIVVIGNVPNGATLSAGVNNGDGTWTLMPGQLSGLTLTPPANYSGNFSLSVTAISGENGTTADVSAALAVNVSGSATTPSLSIQAASGNEDTAITLNISAALTDTDGSETLSVVIGNVPNGATLSAGINNGNGTWTLTPAQLNGLTFTPPEHSSGQFSLSVSAVSSENGTSATASATLNVLVEGVATAPSLAVQAASGNENTAISLVINAALMDNDGSETLVIVISNVPNGATLSAGINNGDGTWTLTSGQLSGLTLTPPAFYHGAINLGVTAQSAGKRHNRQCQRHACRYCRQRCEHSDTECVRRQRA